MEGKTKVRPLNNVGKEGVWVIPVKSSKKRNSSKAT